MNSLETTPPKDIEVIGSRVEKLKTLWNESERRLAILRADTGEEPKPPTNEEVLRWSENLRPCHSVEVIFSAAVLPEAKAP